LAVDGGHGRGRESEGESCKTEKERQAVVSLEGEEVATR